MRSAKRNYSKLWATRTQNKSCGSKQSFKELLKSIDIDSDLTLSTDEYATCIAQGMAGLLTKDLKRKDLMENERFFEKLMDLGKSIMNGAKDSQDLFTLGMLIEAKIGKNFLSLKFYQLILKSLSYIREKITIFTQEFKDKLQAKIQKEAYRTHLDYFYHYKECS